MFGFFSFFFFFFSLLLFFLLVVVVVVVVLFFGAFFAVSLGLDLGGRAGPGLGSKGPEGASPCGASPAAAVRGPEGKLAGVMEGTDSGSDVCPR